MVKVLVGGVFDILHPGHLKFLEKAKEHGDELIVIVACDKKVIEKKSREPLFKQDERLRMIQALEIVDKAILGEETENYLQVVEDAQPDVIVLGYDQKFETLEKDLEENGLDIKVIRLDFVVEEELNKTSKIIQKILKQYQKRSDHIY